VKRVAAAVRDLAIVAPELYRYLAGFNDSTRIPLTKETSPVHPL
jgi:hypothetical protein